MKFRQIASGDGTVDLEAIFLKLNVALIGPGRHGDYFDHKSEYLLLPSWGWILRIQADGVTVPPAE